MKRLSASVYVGSIFVGLAAVGLLLLSAYVGGYVLLANENGLFPSREVFQLYQPAMRVQRWATNRSVDSGYIDGQGRRFALRLPTADEWASSQPVPAAPNVPLGVSRPTAP